MRKLIFSVIFLFGAFFAYSQTAVVRPRVDADLLEGKGTAHYLDTTSTVQSKNGNLTLGGTLTITDLASDNLVVISPTATGEQDTVNTEDATKITFDTLTANVFQVKGTIDGYQSDGTTSLYYHEHNIPAFSAAPGVSGATLTIPTTNTLGGYRLDANTEQLYFSMHIEDDWDGKTNGIVEIYWEINEASAADGTVDLKLTCYYKGDLETTNKTQTIEVPYTYTDDKAQFTQHKTTFTFIWDETSNVVEVGDIIGFIINLETDTSECDDIIINHMVSKYTTTQPALETN